MATEYIGVSELAAAAGDAMSEIAEVDRRMKSGATEIPSERTIRFYLEKGLLPKPAKRFGQTLVFGRVHLLQLLVIKKLQSDGVPLSAIPDVLKRKGKTEAQLEELLQENFEILRTRRELDSFRKPPGQTDDSDFVSYPQTAMKPTRRNAPSDDDAPAAPPANIHFGSPAAHDEFNKESLELTSAEETPATGAKSYLKSLLSRSPKPAARQSLPKTVSETDPEILFSRVASPSPERWTRHEAAPGLEINVSDAYEPPKDEQGKVKLLEKLRNILGL
jgi:DNA-binding transcriptional MerR regulator